MPRVPATAMPIETPELAVLIVTYESAKDLPRCLSSLPEHLGSISHEICVIDNGSCDESAALIAKDFPAVKLIRNPENLGFAAAINQGIKNTRAPYLFWMNPDSQLTGGNASVVLQYFKENPKTGIAGIKILNPDGSLQLSARAFPSYSTALFNRYSILSRLFPHNRFTQHYLGSDWDHTQIREVGWVSGAALFHRREVAEKIGPLDEAFFMYCEDVDFSLRASKAGWKTVYHPGLTVSHAIGGSSKSLPVRMVLERHKSIRHYYRKHFSRNPIKDAFILISIEIRCRFLMLCASFKRRKI